MSFLPDGYKPPVTGSNYLKFEKGITKFRFLDSPILGWEYWVETEDGKRSPRRVRPDAEPPKPELKAKHFWAAIVYDVNSKSVKILNITQKTIMSAIQSLSQDSEWGDPLEYNITVTRSGEGMETEYVTMPNPKSPVPPEALEAAEKINIEALYLNMDPFEIPHNEDEV